jgi:Predicted SAM-dependent methyltransferases
VQKVKGHPGPGDWVSVLDSRGRFLAWGTYSPQSQIRVRLWAWEEGALLTPDLLRQRLHAAYARRQAWLDSQHTDAYRVVFGEADGLPGLIVDRYADTAVVQFLSVGVDRWRDTLADLILELPGVTRVYERSDSEVRHLEGLDHAEAPCAAAIHRPACASSRTA